MHETILQMSSCRRPGCLVPPVSWERVSLALVPLIKAELCRQQMCTCSQAAVHTISVKSVLGPAARTTRHRKQVKRALKIAASGANVGRACTVSRAMERPCAGAHRRSTVSQAAKSSLIRAGNPERVARRRPRHHHNMCLINSDGTQRQNFTLSLFSGPVFRRERVSVSKR